MDVNHQLGNAKKCSALVAVTHRMDAGIMAEEFLEVSSVGEG
jgi:hypothetical protein